MDNKNQNKLNSKALESSALEQLDKAAKGEIVSEQGKKDTAEMSGKMNSEKKESVEGKKDGKTESGNSSAENDLKFDRSVQRSDGRRKKNVHVQAQPAKQDKQVPEKKASEVTHEENDSEKKDAVNENLTAKSEKTKTDKKEENQEQEIKPEVKDEKVKTPESEKTKTDKKKENQQPKEKKKTKEEVEQEDRKTQEEIRNLISTAIENKKNQKKSKTEQSQKTAKKNQEKKKAEDTGEKKVSPENSHNIPKVKAKPIASDDWEENGSFDDDDKEIPQKEKKGFFSRYKKTKITIIAIVSAALLFILLIVFLFFKYMGLLNRNADNSKNYNSMPIDSSEIVGGDDTFDKAKKEAELKAMLSKKAKPISDSDVTNILLIGEDVRNPKEEGRGNTDVMMIISVNKKNKTITLTSLLRDVWVYLDEFSSSNKLNAAFWHGGSDYLEKVVEDYYDIEINRYVSVNFQSFIDIVDAVGGLDFNVKANEAEAMKDPLDEVNDILGRKRGSGYVKAGKQHLDGYQSLAYSRIRYNCGDDYGRTQRQRAVISQIIQKSKKLGLIELDNLLEKVLKKVTTDITNGEAYDMLLEAVFKFSEYKVQQLQIPASGYFEEGIVDGYAVLQPDWDMNRAIIQNVIYGKAKNADEAAKMIQNGTGYKPSDSSSAG